MAKRKVHQELSVMEAVDHLSSLAEMNVEEVLNHERLEETDVQGSEGVRQWINPSDPDKNCQVVRETFKVIHNYLKYLYDKEGERIADKDTRYGVQAIMVLADEAAAKVQKCNALFRDVQNKDPLSSLKEYKDLRDFYLSKIKDKFQVALEKEQESQQKLAIEDEEFDLQKKGLKDLEIIRRDQQYEMFWIKNEEGKPVFNRGMLRHIKLVSDFEQITSDPKGDDPFLRLAVLDDRNLNSVAKEIKSSCSSLMGHFYKEAFLHRDMQLVKDLHCCLMSLMLTTNNRNLIQNTEGKSCHSYFKDFVYYLRACMQSADYLQLIEESKQTEHSFYECVLSLLHKLCYSFYIAGGKKDEFIEFIYRLIHRGEESFSKHHESNTLLSLWNTMLDYDHALRSILQHYPNGPLLKTLDLFSEEEVDYGFDPALQGNYPGRLFSFEAKKNLVTLLRLPSPTIQEFIYKADVSPEFKGFFRAFTSDDVDHGVHLLVNVQDRTALGEHARSIVLENLPKDAEFKDNLVVVTLPKNTDFYRQDDVFKVIGDAEVFKEQVLSQIQGKEECGFYFPFDVDKGSWKKFFKDAVDTIHTLFFEDKAVLSRKARMDFIEILYLYFTLKLVDEYKPVSLSFTCKDALDVGAGQNGLLYAFLKIISHHLSWTEKEKNFLLGLFYLPALSIRDRAIDMHRVHRAISALSVISNIAEKDFDALIKATEKLVGWCGKKDCHIKEEV